MYVICILNKNILCKGYYDCDVLNAGFLEYVVEVFKKEKEQDENIVVS